MNTISSSTGEVTTPDNRKRFQDKFSSHLPLLLLNGDGTIAHVAGAARKLLGFRPSQFIGPAFTSLIHSKNMRQVLSDLSSMQRGRKTQSFWLARLLTGTGRWKWFRITAENRLQEKEQVIILRLRELQD